MLLNAPLRLTFIWSWPGSLFSENCFTDAASCSRELPPLALDIGDLNLHHRRLPIEKIYEELSGDICQRTKGHKKRWLGINDALFEILNQFKRTCSYNRSAAPVIHDGLGTRMTGHALRVIHERVCENAGLKKNSNSRFKTHIR